MSRKINNILWKWDVEPVENTPHWKIRMCIYKYFYKFCNHCVILSNTRILSRASVTTSILEESRRRLVNDDREIRIHPKGLSLWKKIVRVLGLVLNLWFVATPMRVHKFKRNVNYFAGLISLTVQAMLFYGRRRHYSWQSEICEDSMAVSMQTINGPPSNNVCRAFIYYHLFYFTIAKDDEFIEAYNELLFLFFFLYYESESVWLKITLLCWDGNRSYLFQKVNCTLPFFIW